MHAANDGHPARLTIGIIGPGRVGSALGVALERAGHTVSATTAVSEASRRRVAERLPRATVAEPAEVAAEADLLLLTVPDSALADLAAGLAQTGAEVTGRLVAHASGAHGYGVLDPLARAGALTMALHPVMTFTGRPEDLQRLGDCTFGVTAPAELRPAAEALVVEMGAEPVWVAEELRPLYHAALTTGANHLVTLVAESAALLRRAGVADPGRMLGPLLGAALDNALRLGMDGLSGPVARGDADTVQRHVHELQQHAPDGVAAYRAMARLTADRAMESGRLAPRDAERLLDVLSAPRT
jgi:predicted short-subunit dehydrogenase-like oxidoreductase (DUF2520 family)